MDTDSYCEMPLEASERIADLELAVADLMGKLNVTENNVPEYKVERARECPGVGRVKVEHDARGVTTRLVKDLGS